MARILTGVQSTGTPHLGNILGAIIPAIEIHALWIANFAEVSDDARSGIKRRSNVV